MNFEGDAYRGPSGGTPRENKQTPDVSHLADARTDTRGAGITDNQQQLSEDLPRGSANSVNHMESSVTRLLVATKLLLESLTKWSLGTHTESQVSEIYVRLGNDFNAALAAFAGYGIDMSDMYSVPTDLRSCLETCLSETASPAALERYLPRIREIIIRLLQGLKSKQASYKQLLLEQRTQSGNSRRTAHALRTDANTTDSRATLRSSIPASLARSQLMSESSSKGFDWSNSNPVSQPQPVGSHTSSEASSQSKFRAGVANQRESPISSDSRSSWRSNSQLGNHPQPSLDRSQIDRPESSRDYRETLHQIREEPFTTSFSSDSSVTRMPPPAVPTATSVQASELNNAAEVIRGPTTGAGAGVGVGAVAGPTGAATRQAAPAAPAGQTAPAGQAALSSSASEQVAPPSSAPEQTTFKHSAPEQTTFKPSAPEPITFEQLTSEQEASGQTSSSRQTTSRQETPAKSASAQVVPDQVPGNPPGKVSTSTSGSANSSSTSPPHGPRPIMASLPFLGKRAATDVRSQHINTPENLSQAGNPSTSTDPHPNYAGLSAGKPSELDMNPGSSMPSHSDNPDSINLQMLRSRDTLERRASKRFSAYNYNKMGVASGLLQGAGTQLGTSPRSSVESRIRHTPHTSLVNTGEFPSSMLGGADTSVNSIDSTLDSLGGIPAKHTPAEVEPDSFDHAAAETSQDRPDQRSESKVVVPHDGKQAEESYAPSTPNSLHLFVQLGRQTRKVSVAVDPTEPCRGLTIARLRMLFVDQFAYSPGMDNFPPIYIKDPQSGVQYQLDDLEDVQEKSLLTLNIEPLDQVKQHVDLALTNVTKELREMKSLLRDVQDSHETSRVNPKATPIPDAAFKAAGQRVSTYVGTPQLDSEQSATESAPASKEIEAAGLHWAHELKSHYQALQKLRHDFAILRQVHGEAEQDTRSIFDQVREQVKEMEQVTALGPSAGRNLIESGKFKLDARSQEVLTTVEDLQDLVEDLKMDVSHRGVKPRPNDIQRISSEIDLITKRLDELESFVQNVKPGWKKTWESELQNIVDEQEFLHYQEGLIADLKQDHLALQDVFANIQQVVKLRTITEAGSVAESGSRLQRYVPPSPDMEHEGIGTVMIEVRGQSIDHDRRLRALQAAERSREKARAGYKDEFASELAGFVDGNALRKTGGHREVDRIRQKRDQNVLRTMMMSDQHKDPSAANTLSSGAQAQSALPSAVQPNSGMDSMSN
ncbi:Bud site selection protein 6 [Malassezia psittaci]|uniref:Bud site selection protein 6 n=1 Tax=Malassezia psittaci TaxID=1821823 RepID=A0AAF0JGE6_9BASI|nr:Bud site selection protein 6 [Malassezia psittaci]